MKKPDISIEASFAALPELLQQRLIQTYGGRDVVLVFSEEDLRVAVAVEKSLISLEEQAFDESQQTAFC